MNNLSEIVNATQEVIEKIKLELLENTQENKGFKNIINRYTKFINSIEEGRPDKYLVYSLPRAYVEAGGDFSSPILDTMDNIEKFMMEHYPK